MSDTPSPPRDPDSDPPAAGDEPAVYDVTGVPISRNASPDLRALAGALLPRRPGAGRRGALVVDRPQNVAYLLDADDDAGTFRYRDARPLAGDPAALTPAPAGDDVLRAAYETEYDVIAAPWVGADDDQADEPAKPRKRAAARRPKGQ